MQIQIVFTEFQNTNTKKNEKSIKIHFKYTFVFNPSPVYACIYVWDAL